MSLPTAPAGLASDPHMHMHVYVPRPEHLLTCPSGSSRTWCSVGRGKSHAVGKGRQKLRTLHVARHSDKWQGSVQGHQFWEPQQPFCEHLPAEGPHTCYFSCRAVQKLVPQASYLSSSEGVGARFILKLEMF